MIEFVDELSQMESSFNSNTNYVPNEADVRERLIRPMLIDWLGFLPGCIHAENSLGKKRPDYVCRVGLDARTISLCVEVKALNVKLRARPTGATLARIPLVQLSNYLVHRADATDNTWGLLTNGRDWILLRRVGPEDVSEVGACRIESDADLRTLLEPVTQHALAKAPTDTAPFENTWLSSLQARPANARFLLEELSAGLHLTPVPSDMQESIPGMDVARAWMKLESNSNFDTLAPATRLIVAVSEAPDGRIPLADVRSLLDRGAPGCADALVMVAPGVDNRDNTVARLAVRVDGTLRTTLEFDPALPTPAVRSAIEKMQAAFMPDATNQLNLLNEALSPRHLERKFFEEAGNWFESIASEQANKEELLLLIQLLFVWLLRERGWIPEELFLPPEQNEPADAFHQQLMTLCTKVMSQPLEERTVHGALWDDVPFLNGSLFRERKTEPAVLSNDDYFATGKKPGIITILRRYQWTLSEQGSTESELAMDPSLLGALFEQLVVKAEGITPSATEKMPDGTYYTPLDLVDEMVCDALSEAVAARVEDCVVDDIAALLHPEPADVIDSNRWQKTALYDNKPLRELVGKTLKQLIVLDPCTGSGAFIVGVLNTLRRAAGRLEGSTYDDARRVRDAVKQQLFALDKMPLAVQIARLRLFIAIVDGLDPKHGNPPPLPNLEVRIISADLLATDISGAQHSMLDTDPKVKTALNELAKNRQNYVNSDKPEDKQRRIAEDNRLREVLCNELEQHATVLADQSAFLSWLKTGIHENDEQTAELDPKLLFQQSEGWDVVIGNPPYQKPTTKEKGLAEARGYETTKSNDLYTLCTEAVFALAKDAKGVVTLVVPHSITFAKSKQHLRNLINKQAERLLLRTYDNRPKPVFPPHPFIKGGDTGAENTQRVSIFIARKGDEAIQRFCTGYIRLAAATRIEQLRKRPTGAIVSGTDGPWPHVPTAELARLLEVMSSGSKTNTRTAAIQELTFPPTCRYFISCLPPEILDHPTRNKYPVRKDRYYAWLSLYNSHLFHAYWLMTGDGFHLRQVDISSVLAPRGWDDPKILAKATKAGFALVNDDVIEACYKNFTGERKKIFPNVDFHSNRQDLIEICDRINLCAYGFKGEPLETLLKQMRILRTGSADALME